MREYLVISTYDNGDRWAESYRARTPKAAERMALKQYPGVIIAGTVPYRVPCLCGREHTIEVTS